MLRPRKRKCRCCKGLFNPDYRTTKRQRYCPKEPCRKASKAMSQKLWLSKPENRDYFRGAVHVERKRRWRVAHPERARRGARSRKVPQDKRVSQASGSTEESGNLAACVPQDVILAQPLALIGLIAKLTDSTSQDEIAKASLSLIRLGQDIVQGVSDGGKASAVPRASATGTAAV